MDNQKPEQPKPLAKTFYQKGVTALLAFAGVLITISLLLLAAAYFIFTGTAYFYPFMAIGAALLILGLVFLIVSLFFQERVEVLNKNHLATYRYSAWEGFRFFSQTRPKKKGILYCAIAAAVFLLIATILFLSGVAIPIVRFVYILAGLCVLLILLQLTVVSNLFHRLRFYLFPWLKETILSRSGIVCQGRHYNFRSRFFIYIRCEQKELSGRNALIFHYQKKRGYQLVLKELPILLPAQTTQQEINRLLDIYGSSSLLSEIITKKNTESE